MLRWSLKCLLVSTQVPVKIEIQRGQGRGGGGGEEILGGEMLRWIAKCLLVSTTVPMQIEMVGRRYVSDKNTLALQSWSETA